MTGERVVAFLGGSGWGKSTMAGSLRLRGHTVVADDVVVIAFNKCRNIPHLKLWPEALHCLGEDPARLPHIHPGYEKRSLALNDAFLQRPAELRHIYVLAEGRLAQIVPLTPQCAFVEVIRHLYLAFIPEILDGKSMSTHLTQFTSLCASVPISFLKRPRSMALISDVVDLVEKDCA